jgi:integrase
MERLDAMRRLHMRVFRPKRRAYYVMRWRDPITGRPVERTTRQKSRREALDVAAGLALEMLDNRPGDPWWVDFCAAYEQAVESSRPGRAREPWLTTKAWIAKLDPPRRLSEVTTQWVTRWQHRLRHPEPHEGRQPLAENTIASYSARLRAALNWARRQGYFDRPPIIETHVENRPRSRAIVGEELDRILAAIPQVRPADPSQWDRMVRGQWACGFRLGELVALSWDEAAPVHVETRGAFPFVVMAADANKKRKERLRAITPEFWAICCETPANRRHGPIFPIRTLKGELMSLKRICRTIGRFGKKAGVVTNPTTGKTATSHDTRRGFACQMDGRGLTLAELQRWMDHADIRTTLTYYRTAEAEQLAAKLWQNTPGAPSGVNPGVSEAPHLAAAADSGEKSQ